MINSLMRSKRYCYWPHYQGFSKLWFKRYVGRSTLNLDDVIVTLRENKRMMRTKNIDDEHNAIVVVESGRWRNNSRRHYGPRGRLKSQSRPQQDMSNMQCYFCSENGHV